MVLASLLFALMGVCVKFASAQYGTGEIVFYRSLMGLVLMAGALRWLGMSWRTPVPAMHFWRSACGTTALCMWFYAIGVLPLATAMTLNYTAPVWIALFLMGGTLLLGPGKPGVDGRVVSAVMAGFAGVLLVLRPTLQQEQLWGGLIALLSGLISAMAYLQVSALGRVGEPGERVVLYFSLAGVVAGAALALASGGLHRHTLHGVLLLVAIGVLATVAQWLMTRAYATGSAMAISALQYLGIGYAFGLGVWLFDDPVTAQALAGMALIVAAGIAATQLRSRGPRTDASPTET
ncbi:MAG: DMT family transporter [Rubrivivax sp.]|nr:DMT family transporter [Rubrivivax sp.]